MVERKNREKVVRSTQETSQSIRSGSQSTISVASGSIIRTLHSGSHLRWLINRLTIKAHLNKRERERESHEARERCRVAASPADHLPPGHGRGQVVVVADSCLLNALLKAAVNQLFEPQCKCTRESLCVHCFSPSS